MKYKYGILAFFMVMVLAQLFVPAKMIWDREDIIKTGKLYKFKTRPVDPNDPFRGKYITLNYDANTYEVTDFSEWQRNEEVYVEFDTDKYGFAKIKSVYKEKPTDIDVYLKTKVNYISTYNKLTFDYPFDRYYMEESKAYEAEKTYAEVQRDTTKTTYALVHIKKGGAVLTDVLINEVSIREIVKKK